MRPNATDRLGNITNGGNDASAGARSEWWPGLASEGEVALGRLFGA